MTTRPMCAPLLKMSVPRVHLPVVVSVTSELNIPRLPPLPAILKASKKPMATWSPADLGFAKEQIGANAAVAKTLSNLAPEQERKQVMFEGDLEEGELEIGQISASIRDIKPASVIVNEIWNDFLTEKDILIQ